ncbi:MAG: hypothetical protein ACE5E5_13755 [Phycisphaerae bacterium]
MDSPRTISTRPTRRAVAALFVGFAVTLLIGDGILVLITPPEVYGSTNRSLWKWRLYEKTPERPDIVFLGCSYEVHAINPAVVDAELSHVHGRTLRSINLAASASSLLTEYLMVRRLLDRGDRPSIVYLGVTPNAADTWLHPWLINGLKALGDWRDLALAAKGGSYLLAQAVPRSVFQSYHQWDDWRIIAERIILGAAIHPKTALTRYDTGWAEWRGRPVTHRGMAKDRPIDPSRIDPARIDPGNVNGIAIRHAIGLLRGCGVAVRLVELPLSTHAAAFADPSRNADYQRFIQTLVQQTGVRVVRPPRGIVTDADYWDDVHVTAAGAEKISKWLAADVAQALADDSTTHLARNDS